jgi:hypothetical protein
MAKGNSGSSNREAKVAKAGKRSGNTVWPAPISSERRAGKDQGEQQFVAKEQITVQREIPWIVYDKALQAFVYSTKKITIPAEYVFDASRGRVVYSPSFKEKSSK